MAKLTFNPPGTPLPSNHPFSKGLIVFGHKPPTRSAKASTPSAETPPAPAASVEAAPTLAPPSVRSEQTGDRKGQPDHSGAQALQGDSGIEAATGSDT